MLLIFVKAFSDPVDELIHDTIIIMAVIEIALRGKG